MMLCDVTQNGTSITGMLTNIAMAILSTFHLNLSFFIFGTHTTVIHKVPAVTCFLTKKIRQDPLEKLFGC